MTKCLLITFTLKNSRSFLQSVVQKTARSLAIEGTVQAINDHDVRVFACGQEEALDDFLDALHKHAALDVIANIEIEPLLKEKDFRGVFRVIE